MWGPATAGTGWQRPLFCVTRELPDDVRFLVLKRLFIVLEQRISYLIAYSNLFTYFSSIRPRAFIIREHGSG